jgi:hypothetical protein
MTAALTRLATGECSYAEAASVLVDVVSAPSLLQSAAARALASFGTEHEGTAVAEALALIAEFAVTARRQPGAARKRVS